MSTTWKQLACVFVLSAIIATPAFADEIIGFQAWRIGTAFILAFPFYFIIVSLIEACVLVFCLDEDFHTCFWYCLAANAVSTVMGFVWEEVFGAGGWKTAMASHRAEFPVLLFARSYVLTVAEETLVVGLISGCQRSWRHLLRAVATMNGLSYTFIGLDMYLFLR